MKKPIISEIAHQTYAIYESGKASCYLLWGSERGMLIDCGLGICDIKSIADQLCPVPYDVVLTHGHRHNTGSIRLWKQVWVHPADIDMLSADNAPEFLPIRWKKSFLLGDREVYIVNMPGHTPGSISLVDPYSRIAFTGDSCSRNMSIRHASIVRALVGMNKLKEQRSMFDRIFPGHLDYSDGSRNISLPVSVLDECIHIMEGVKCETICAEVVADAIVSDDVTDSINLSGTVDMPDSDGQTTYMACYGSTRITFAEKCIRYNGLYMNEEQGEDVPRELLIRAREKKGVIECIHYTSMAYAKDGHTLKKRAYVYLPYGYDPQKKYPILYLMHGGGDHEIYWLITHDETVTMVDHMIELGMSEETIICTPTFYYRDGTDALGADHDLPWNFYKELRNDIIPIVEKKYATYANGDTSLESLIASREKRGFAGLSMGSMTTHWSALANCLDIIGYFGPFSGCIGPFGSQKDAAQQLHFSIDQTFSQYPVCYLLAMNGTWDISHDEHVNIMKELLELTDKLKDGVNYQFIDVDKALHDYQLWAYCLYRFLQIFARQ